jgi:peptidoglycan/LPS O-acetylase OafA/YrhL
VTQLRRIPELDGVRGCAVGLVLIFHLVVRPIEAPPATLWSYTQAAGRLTWSGVDLFLVLSGFLIGGIPIDSRDSPNYFRAFYARRFFRIVPLYMVILGIALIAKRGTIDEHIPTFSYFIFCKSSGWLGLTHLDGFSPLLGPSLSKSSFISRCPLLFASWTDFT